MIPGLAADLAALCALGGVALRAVAEGERAGGWALALVAAGAILAAA